MSKRNAPAAQTTSPASVKADAVAVVAAATNLNGTQDSVTLKEVIQQAAVGFAPAVAIQAAKGAELGAETDVSKAATAALAEVARLDAQEPEIEKLSWPEFPADFKILNNGTFGFGEPVTGAYLPAGGSAIVTFHDEAHADKVADSLKALAEQHYLAPGALVVQLAPQIKSEDAP